jgi:hypothetical protein
MSPSSVDNQLQACRVGYSDANVGFQSRPCPHTVLLSPLIPSLSLALDSSCGAIRNAALGRARLERLSFFEAKNCEHIISPLSSVPWEPS